MEVKILDEGDNYLNCIYLYDKREFRTCKRTHQCSLSEDVLYKMRFEGEGDLENIRIKFSQADNKKQLIYHVKLHSLFMNLNKEYAVDDSEWHLIYEEDTECVQYKYMIDLRFQIKPLFEKLVTFAPLYEDTTLTDFELHGEDGSVQIHGAALAAFNPTFRRMLEGNWKETQERALKIPQISKATLQHLKDYIYLNVLPQSGVEDLLLLASLYMMDDLNKKCSDKIIQTLKADNFNVVLKFSMDNNLKILYKGVLECVQYGSIKVSDITKDSVVSDITT